MTLLRPGAGGSLWCSPLRAESWCRSCSSCRRSWGFWAMRSGWSSTCLCRWAGRLHTRPTLSPHPQSPAGDTHTKKWHTGSSGGGAQRGSLQSEHVCDSERVKQAGDEWSQAFHILILAAQDVVVVGNKRLKAQWLTGRKQRWKGWEMEDEAQQRCSSPHKERWAGTTNAALPGPHRKFCPISWMDD